MPNERLTANPSCKDEMRVGQKGTLTRVRAATGSRPRALRSDGYRSVRLSDAACPSRDPGRALIPPRYATAAMALFLAEPGGHVAPGAHAVVVPDGAGWHTARGLRRPADLTPLPLPAYSPELNPPERVRAFLRRRYLALRRFLDPTAALLDACRHAWRRLIGEPGRIRSLCSYSWAAVP